MAKEEGSRNLTLSTEEKSQNYGTEEGLEIRIFVGWRISNCGADPWAWQWQDAATGF
jgi:hypothetical protein